MALWQISSLPKALLFLAALRLFSVSIPTRSRLCPRRSMHHERVPAAADPRSCRGRPISASLVACGGVAGASCAALVAAAHDDARDSAPSAGLSSLWQSILLIGTVCGHSLTRRIRVSLALTV